jgi:hypothetical protein
MSPRRQPRSVSSEPLSPRVMRVLSRLRSGLELELLLLLCELADQEWSPGALADMLDADPADTRTALINLSRAGLVQRLYGGESSCFRFDPRTEPAQSVEELGACYVSRPARVVGLIEAEGAAARDSSPSSR